MSTLGTTQQNEFYANPMVKKLAKIEETSEDHATYSGVIKKCMFFMAMIIVGIAVAIILHTIPGDGIRDDEGTLIKYPEMIFGGVMALALIVGPIVASLVPKTVPVLGSMTCMSMGYIFMLLGQLFPDYGGAIILALVLTFAIVLSMQFLYASGKVRVTQKFRTVLMSSLLAYIIGGVLIGICYFIPGMQGIFVFLFKSQVHTVLSILISLGGVVLASLFLVVDFDTIHHLVENQLPKKYEWSASFSLCLTVIWLYLEIFNLISAAKDNSN